MVRRGHFDVIKRDGGDLYALCPSPWKTNSQSVGDNGVREKLSHNLC